MDAKVFTEGSRALCLWSALQADLSEKAQTEEEREAAHDMLSLLTPVIKGFTTDKGYETATNMQQVFGGHPGDGPLRAEVRPKGWRHCSGILRND